MPNLNTFQRQIISACRCPNADVDLVEALMRVLVTNPSELASDAFRLCARKARAALEEARRNDPEFYQQLVEDAARERALRRGETTTA